MDCTGVADILVLHGGFVAEVVEEVELVVVCAVRLVLRCANGRRDFCDVLALCRLK